MSLVDPPRDTLPTRAELRQLTDVLLGHDSDINGFVYDHFPQIMQRFRPGLSRTGKLDLLLEHAEPSELLRRLRERGLHGRKRRASEILDFSSERSQHPDLYGRQQVQSAIVEALGRGGWLIISGGAGRGKSALLSHLLNQIEQATRRSVPSHFMRRTSADSARPGVVLRSLAAQVEAIYPGCTDRDAQPEMRLLELLRRVSQRGLNEGDSLVLIVDGLEEAESEGRSNPLARFLPPELPAGITLACSIDPRSPHYAWLLDHTARQLAGHIDLDSDTWSESNRTACRSYLTHNAARLGLSKEFLEWAVEASDGNLLYAGKLLEYCEVREAAGDGLLAPTDLPLGLFGLLQLLWGELTPEARAVLGMLHAARQAIPFELLDELLGFDEGGAEKALAPARPLVSIEAAPVASSLSSECVRFAHGAIREFVELYLGPMALHQSSRQLASALCSWPPLEDGLYGFRRLYALRHAITQHIETEAVSHTAQVVSNGDYLIAKCQEHGSAALAEDLEHAAARCGVPETARTFAALSQALRIASHWLAQDPGALPGLLYNLLRCANWMPSAIERAVHFPPQRLRFRLAHPLQRRDTSVHSFAGHWDSVLACGLTPEARRLISVGLDKTVRLWDLNSGALMMSFYGQAGAATAFAVTADGNSLLYAGSEHSLVRCDLTSGALSRRYRGHTGPLTSVCLHPDGQHVLTASADQTLRLWQLSTGEEAQVLRGHRAAITSCVITADGSRAVSAAWDGAILVWDLNGRSLHRALSEHRGAVSALALLESGQQVVSASWDHTLRLWNLRTGALIQTFSGHAAPVNSCVVTKDGKLLVSASDDLTLRIWDLSNGRELRILAGHNAGVKACVLAPDGHSVISISEDCTLRQWDLQTGLLMRTFTGHIGPVLHCAVAKDGRQLISASEDRMLKLWDLGASIEASQRDGHTDALNACYLLPDGLRAVTASEDGSMKLWDVMRGEVIRTFIEGGEAVTACALGPDGRQLVSAMSGKSLVVWDTDSGGQSQRFMSSVSGRDSSSRPSSSHLAFPSEDHMIELWGMPLDSSNQKDGTVRLRVRGCQITPDGAHLVTCGGDRVVRLWDLSTGAELMRFTGHTGAVNGCALLPDGTKLISASSDKTLILWDLSTGAELMRFTGHSGPVSCCAVSPDGRRLLSGSQDKSLRLWDLENGSELLRLSSHAAAVSGCVFSPDGRRAVSTSLDYTVRIWELFSGMPVETIYGSSPFLCIDAKGDWLCAGDRAGNVWFLRDLTTTTPSMEVRPTRPSLVESLRRLLAGKR